MWYNKKMNPRAIVLFSGGKDSIYSLEASLSNHNIIMLVSIISDEGVVQMTDGPEIEKNLFSDLIQLFPFPYKKIVTNNADNYLDQIVSAIRKIVEEEHIEIIITGDLNHTEGIDKVLHKELGIQCISLANDFVKEFGQEVYLEDMRNKGIEFILSGTRNEAIPPSFIGNIFDKKTIDELKKNNVDITGEDGEFQTLVTNSPTMTKKIVIDSFILGTDEGRDKKGHSYTFMKNTDYSVIDKS